MTLSPISNFCSFLEKPTLKQFLRLNLPTTKYAIYAFGITIDYYV